MTRGRTCPDLRKTLNDQDCPAEKISRIAKKGRYELERILLRPNGTNLSGVIEDFEWRIFVPKVREVSVPRTL